MQGREPPVKDVSSLRQLVGHVTRGLRNRKIYTGKPQENSQRKPTKPEAKAPVVGAVFAPQSAHQQQVIPEVERMRRGRPPTSSQPAPQSTQQNPSPPTITNGDPFAALDSKVSAPGADELSSRFPTLDQFSILHDQGAKFDFDSTVPSNSQPHTKDLNQRLAERLADDAFQIRPSPPPGPPSVNHRQSIDMNRPAPGASTETQRASPPLKPSSAPPKPSEMSRASAIISSTPELQAISSQASKSSYQPVQETRQTTMVSTGTMTTPPPEKQATSQYQVYRFPPGDRDRASSLPRQQDVVPAPSGRPEVAGSPRIGAVGSRTPSIPALSQPGHIRHSSSSRPSLEGGRPNLDNLDSSKPKQQLGLRPRPVSAHLESNIDFLREREASGKSAISPGHPSPRYSADKDLPPPPGLTEDEMNIESNVEFLRSMEESDHTKKDHGRGKHIKRSSLTSLGAGTKNILAGKFGEAFKRFEGGAAPPPRTPSPLKELGRRDLTPIAGSEATDGRSDDGQVRDYEDMTPEMRREEEARMLAQEEARVAAAQAEYRQRVAQRGSGQVPLPKSIGGVSRAVSIQNKVQSLLDETTKSSSNVTRTAQGYGQYTDAAPPRSTGGESRPAIPRKPIGSSGAPYESISRVVSSNPSGSVQHPSTSANSSSVDLSSTGRTSSSSLNRPAAPPKPVHLNKNPTSGGSVGGRAGSPPKPSLASNAKTSLVAVDLPGQPSLPMTPTERDDYIRDFQKRFPSLTSIEMVERDLAAEDGGRR